MEEYLDDYRQNSRSLVCLESRLRAEEARLQAIVANRWATHDNRAFEILTHVQEVHRSTRQAHAQMEETHLQVLEVHRWAKKAGMRIEAHIRAAETLSSAKADMWKIEEVILRAEEAVWWSWVRHEKTPCPETFAYSI